MLILAIESSCDETAAAVVSDGREVLSSIVSSQVDLHSLFGGVVPEIASRKHIEVISKITKEALEDAKASINNVDALAVTYTPGLVGSLLVGINFVKGLSISTGLPVIPVNHLRAHIASNYIEHKDLSPPFLGIVASGGHTLILKVLDYTKFEIIGSTRDDAIGESFDKVARILGIPYPGGANLDSLAEKGNDSAYKFPIPKILDSEYDLSFSGLKTAVINFVNKAKSQQKDIKKEDFAASFRKVAVKNLLNKVIKALKNFKYTKVAIGGGAAANQLLRKELTKACYEFNAKLYIPKLSLCSDNAAMVGAQAYFEFLKGNVADLTLNAISRV